MFDFETIVSGIEFKVRQLSDEVHHLRSVISEQGKQISQLEQALNDKEKLINTLKEENKIVKLGNRLNEGNDSAELKLKITQMIRSIDRSLEIIKGME